MSLTQSYQNSTDNPDLTPPPGSMAEPHRMPSSASKGKQTSIHIPIILPSLQSSLESSFRSTPDRWENPRESIGDFYSVSNSRFGTIKFWEGTGPAGAVWEVLNPQIMTLLNTHGEDSKLKPAVLVSCGFFMAGKNEDTASPALVVICKDKRTSSRIKKIIETSGILSQPEFREVKLMSSRSDPQHPGSEIRAIASDVESEEPAVESSNRSIYRIKSDEQVACGMKILVPSGDPRLEKFRKATIGGFLQVANGEIMGLTVAHVFEINEALPTEEDPTTGDRLTSAEGADSDYDSGSDFEFDVEFDVVPPNHGLGSSLRNEKESPELPLITHPYRDLQEIGTLHAISTSSKSGLDWALIKFSKSISHPGIMGELSPPTTHLTSLCDEPPYPHLKVVRLEGNSLFVEVWEVEFSGELAYGDSGTWVFGDLEDKSPFIGTIVAGDVHSGLAYVILASNTLADIQSVLGVEVKPAYHDYDCDQCSWLGSSEWFPDPMSYVEYELDDRRLIDEKPDATSKSVPQKSAKDTRDMKTAADIA